MKPKVIMNDEIGFSVFDTILERWKATPKKFPYDQRDAVIPQTIIPDWLRHGDDPEAIYLFYFFICLYMRGGIESLQAFRAMLDLRADHPELFDPFYAQHCKHEELQPILKEYIGWDSKNVAYYWIENARRLMRHWDGKASGIFKGLGSHEEALRRIQNKRKKRDLKAAQRVDDRAHGFMGFQPKMVSMLVYFIDWEGLLKKQFIYPTPADFHNFRLALALRIMVLDPQPKNLRSAEHLSKPWRDLTVRYLKARRGRVTPVELADAIWLFSLTACGTSPLTDYREPKKTATRDGEFARATLEHDQLLSFHLKRYKKRLMRSCLACPLLRQCELSIPAGPYYKRGNGLGGQLYLWPRYPIERYMTPVSISYLPTPRVEPAKVSGAEQTVLFDDD